MPQLPILWLRPLQNLAKFPGLPSRNDISALTACPPTSELLYNPALRPSVRNSQSESSFFYQGHIRHLFLRLFEGRLQEDKVKRKIKFYVLCQIAYEGQIAYGDVMITMASGNQVKYRSIILLDKYSIRK